MKLHRMMASASTSSSTPLSTTLSTSSTSSSPAASTSSSTPLSTSSTSSSSPTASTSSSTTSCTSSSTSSSPAASIASSAKFGHAPKSARRVCKLDAEVGASLPRENSSAVPLPLLLFMPLILGLVLGAGRIRALQYPNLLSTSHGKSILPLPPPLPPSLPLPLPLALPAPPGDLDDVTRTEGAPAAEKSALADAPLTSEEWKECLALLWGGRSKNSKSFLAHRLGRRLAGEDVFMVREKPFWERCGRAIYGNFTNIRAIYCPFPKTECIWLAPSNRGIKQCQQCPSNANGECTGSDVVVQGINCIGKDVYGFIFNFPFETCLVLLRNHVSLWLAHGCEGMHAEKQGNIENINSSTGTTAAYQTPTPNSSSQIANGNSS
eukprot:GHVT01001965.1.p1 GENE.GHVT01001965.1~~GHVT01001965.1.p1  ORF type:complete len:379 (-),score=76.98 GHVT01001965.1:1316-2452(-)